jgi:hypothetical protein
MHPAAFGGPSNGEDRQYGSAKRCSEAGLERQQASGHPMHRLEQREVESREAGAGPRRKRATRRLAVPQQASVIRSLCPLWLGAGGRASPKNGEWVLVTSFLTAFQGFVRRDGNLGSLLRNQERGEKCKKLATMGVQTPGRPPGPSLSAGRHRTDSGLS